MKEPCRLKASRGDVIQFTIHFICQRAINKRSGDRTFGESVYMSLLSRFA